MDAKDILFVGLAIALVFYGTVLLRGGFAVPTALEGAVGFVTAFLDTLGIGSFATTTAAYKLRKMVPVKQIPGTMNVGHALSTIVQAFIYTKIVPVDSWTLIPMIAAACAGSWIGAGVVVHWPRRRIQIGMGTALLVAAPLIVLTALKIIPGGGDAVGLTPVRLAIGMAGNFAFGALMMLGIGLYAPCMIMVALLGMDPRAAFPIMMGSCAFLMPICSIRFVRARNYHVQASWGLALGGFPAVLIAAYIVRSLPLGAVSWLVAAVVIYTSLNMLLTARAEDPAEHAVPMSVHA